MRKAVIKMGANGAAEIRSAVSPIETKIQDAMSEYAVKKETLKEKRKKLEEALMQDDQYHNAKTLIQETNKQKKEIREEIIREDAELRDLDEQITKLTDSMKDKQLSIFEDLLEYNKTTGKVAITDHAGESHFITIEAKTDL